MHLDVLCLTEGSRLKGKGNTFISYGKEKTNKWGEIIINPKVNNPRFTLYKVDVKIYICKKTRTINIDGHRMDGKMDGWLLYKCDMHY